MFNNLKHKINWCSFGIDGIWWCNGCCESYFYPAQTKFGKTRFIGFNVRIGVILLRFGKKNRINHHSKLIK